MPNKKEWKRSTGKRGGFKQRGFTGEFSQGGQRKKYNRPNGDGARQESKGLKETWGPYKAAGGYRTGMNTSIAF